MIMATRINIFVCFFVVDGWSISMVINFTTGLNQENDDDPGFILIKPDFACMLAIHVLICFVSYYASIHGMDWRMKRMMARIMLWCD